MVTLPPWLVSTDFGTFIIIIIIINIIIIIIIIITICIYVVNEVNDPSGCIKSEEFLG